MARIRTIKPEFWEDEKIGKLPIPCRLFFIGCWNFADDFGVIKGNAALLKSQIFPYDENLRVSEIKKWIDALVDARMLVPIIHAEESYYFIRTFRSHQVLDKRYDKSYIGKGIVKELISKALNDNDVNTTSTLRDNYVNTTEEKEEEKEDKKESPNGDKKEAKASSSASSNPDFLKFNDWLKRNAPYCSNAKNFSSQITEAEFLKLKEKYTGKQIADIIEQIENRKDLRKRYTNLYRTVLNWAKKEYGN
ncbi:hypothetical protein [Bacteroides fragilis]|uniref:hypothetical protein n=1 Tax=Bacteroides fragilis TaxID=817 RepID=UPI000818BAD0|nr:hypothetical protein [Bacteroides fragilis]OCR34461.1 hypothetical protein AC141_33470 [Bacteroides fragilis]USA58892.1 hypothetical protein NC657_06240 [Bacteroides fragilis]